MLQVNPSDACPAASTVTLWRRRKMQYSAKLGLRETLGISSRKRHSRGSRLSNYDQLDRIWNTSCQHGWHSIIDIIYSCSMLQHVWGRSAIKSSDTANAPDIWPNWACRLLHREAAQTFSLSLWAGISCGWNSGVSARRSLIRDQDFKWFNLKKWQSKTLKVQAGCSAIWCMLEQGAGVVPTHVTNNRDKVAAVCNKKTDSE